MQIPPPSVHLRVERLTKAYGSRVALDSVSFEVRRGETLGLLGPNGAGKTTLLHVLSGLLAPDSGRVELTPSEEDRPRRARFGLAPQPLALYRELSAEENLRFFGRLYGLSGALLEERVEWALLLVALTARRRERMAALSGGMQRRLNLACAIIHDPEILLLDEPSTGVDPQSRSQLFEGLEALRSRGTTILYSTHHLEEAERLCDRVAIFDSGRIVAIDSVGSLIRAHSPPAPAERRHSDLEDVLFALTARGSR
jgi:ABC-2 type transport system ATP-binding protein